MFALILKFSPQSNLSYRDKLRGHLFQLRSIRHPNEITKEVTLDDAQTVAMELTGGNSRKGIINWRKVDLRDICWRRRNIRPHEIISRKEKFFNEVNSPTRTNEPE